MKLPEMAKDSKFLLVRKDILFLTYGVYFNWTDSIFTSYGLRTGVFRID